MKNEGPSLPAINSPDRARTLIINFFIRETIGTASLRLFST